MIAPEVVMIAGSLVSVLVIAFIIMAVIDGLETAVWVTGMTLGVIAGVTAIVLGWAYIATAAFA